VNVPSICQWQIRISVDIRLAVPKSCPRNVLLSSTSLAGMFLCSANDCFPADMRIILRLSWQRKKECFQWQKFIIIRIYSGSTVLCSPFWALPASALCAMVILSLSLTICVSSCHTHYASLGNVSSNFFVMHSPHNFSVSHQKLWQNVIGRFCQSC